MREYSELRRLRGDGIRGQSCAAAAACLVDRELDAAEPSPALDQRLLRISQEQGDAAALLCLRCRVSHPVEAWLRAAHRQWQGKGVELATLASYGLDDNGRLRLRIAKNEDVPFVYAELASRPNGLISPFTAEVIRGYDPAQCGLPHWSRQKIQAHNGLKAYLREQGVLLISDWALLRHTSLLRTREACEVFGPSALALEQCLEFKRRYDGLHDAAKQAYKARSGKASGWTPDQAFLEQLAPGRNPFTTREQLLGISSAIRQLLTGKLETSLTTAEGEQLDLPASSSEAAEVDSASTSPEEQLALIEAALQRALDQHMPAVLAGDGKSSALMRCLWAGWAEGLTNRPLAERCGTSCGTVSKKLRPTDHATAVATAAAVELKRHQTFSSCSQSVEAAERLVEALRNHLLTPKREGDVAPLRQWIQNALRQP